jgi:hypothetical protein
MYAVLLYFVLGSTVNHKYGCQCNILCLGRPLFTSRMDVGHTQTFIHCVAGVYTDETMSLVASVKWCIKFTSITPVHLHLVTPSLSVYISWHYSPFLTLAGF